MGKVLFSVVALGLVFGLVLAGCGPKKTTSSNEAIETAKSMETLEEKANYLIGQAKALYNSKEFQEAVDIAQYILRYLDKDSLKAKDLLEKAKNALVSQAQGAVEDVKKKLPGFGK